MLIHTRTGYVNARLIENAWESKPRKEGGFETAISVRGSESVDYALDEVGAIPPACSHIPPNTKCVTVEQWREYSYMRSGADKPDTKLKNFVRGCDYLSADGDWKTVGILGAYAWLT